VNNLPGVMREVRRVIKPDAPFIGVMFTEDTLFELRSSLQVAETEKFGVSSVFGKGVCGSRLELGNGQLCGKGSSWNVKVLSYDQVKGHV